MWAHTYTHLLNFSSLFAFSKVHWPLTYYLSVPHPPFSTPSYSGAGILKITFPGLVASWFPVRFCHQETLAGDQKAGGRREASCPWIPKWSSCWLQQRPGWALLEVSSTFLEVLVLSMWDLLGWSRPLPTASPTAQQQVCNTQDPNSQSIPKSFHIFENKNINTIKG